MYYNAVVGYYDASVQSGNNKQVPAINLAGLTPLFLQNFNAQEFEDVDIILTQNPDNSNIGNEFKTNLADLDFAVETGKTFILDDRWVNIPESYLPGWEVGNGGEDAIRRGFNNDRNIDIVYEPLRYGRGGALDDATLDNGTSSNHGYAFIDQLPDQAITLLDNGNDNQAVAFAYPFGQGTVVYSSIPIDYYFEGWGPANLKGGFQIYAANLLGLISEGAFGAVFTPDPDLVISLLNDTGTFFNDGITNNGSIFFDPESISQNDEYYQAFNNGESLTPQVGISTPLVINGDGTYDLLVKTLKFTPDGFQEQDQATLTFTLDTVGDPAYTFLLDGTDSGTFEDDNYTNTLTFANSGLEEGGYYEYKLFNYENENWLTGEETEEINPDSPAFWENYIEDGEWTLATRQVDVAGNYSLPTLFGFTLDTVAETPYISFTDDGEDKNDGITGKDKIKLEVGEDKGYFNYKYSIDGVEQETIQTDKKFIKFDQNGEYSLVAEHIDLAGNKADSEELKFIKRDVLFSSRLLEADGITEASGLELASWGSKHDMSRKYVLEISAETLGKRTLDGLDFTLDFNNSIFKAVDGKDIEIDDSLPLANSALIDNEDGTVRIAAGSAKSLDLGTGIKSKTDVLRLLVDLDDKAFAKGQNKDLLMNLEEGVNYENDLISAGIGITANIDETIFDDLATLRDRGGHKAYQLVGDDISVSRANTELEEKEAFDVKIASKLTTGREEEVFTNLVRKGDTFTDDATWKNVGDAATTNTLVTLDRIDHAFADVELTVNGEVIGEDKTGKKRFDLEITREADGTVSAREEFTMEVSVNVTGDAGNVLQLDEKGIYSISSDGGYTWTGSGITSTKNLITYQGDLNYDGKVSIKDLAWLNAGANNIEEDGAVAKDVDANFDGSLNMEDLAALDADWGKTLHTGEVDEFTGSDLVSVEELAANGGIEWNNDAFLDQNAIEAIKDGPNKFVGTLDDPLVVGVIDGDNKDASENDIQGLFLNNDIV